MSYNLISAIAASDWTEADLNLLAVNVLHGGIPSKTMKREAAAAIRTLRDILVDARAAHSTSTQA